MEYLYKPPTSIGELLIVYNEEAVTGLYFASSKERKPEGESNPVLELCVKELDAYFAGTLSQFTVPVRLAGTEFREKVWNELLKIPYGETITYGQLAQRVGNPKAVRAVGGANHHNPVSIIVPCHRVIGGDGSLTGYGGGIENKKWLLEHEKQTVSKR